LLANCSKLVTSCDGASVESGSPGAGPSAGTTSARPDSRYISRAFVFLEDEPIHCVRNCQTCF